MPPFLKMLPQLVICCCPLGRLSNPPLEGNNPALSRLLGPESYLIIVSFISCCLWGEEAVVNSMR